VGSHPAMYEEQARQFMESASDTNSDDVLQTNIRTTKEMLTAY
jgi:hypothetical protein